MSRQERTQHAVLSMIFILGILGSHALAQPDFLDDFSDGDPADGSPVSWRPIAGWQATAYTMTPDGLAATDARLIGGPDESPSMYGDVSITVQLSRQSQNASVQWSSGFCFRWNKSGMNGYWIEVRNPNVFRFGCSPVGTLVSVTLPFNVDEQDLMIHMEAKGQQIKGWCWPAGQSMPEAPQISTIDSAASSGFIDLYALSELGDCMFRSVEVYSIKTPIVDFNGDGAFNVDDLARFIKTWGQDNPATDFWHDGTVDKKDLEILMESWGKDVIDPTLAAHWALDETEGDVASDSQGLVDATLVGAPTWQSDAGVIGGAIALDGQHDYLVTDTVLNPGDGLFSLLAWVKDGEPGQVILSQANGKDLLCTDPADGCLMTGLTGSGRSPSTLCSETVITDGNWHRIALVWEGDIRTLYVDNVIVAQDTQAIPGDCMGGLNIGCGNSMASGTFFAGLIDDIRIYDRAVTP